MKRIHSHLFLLASVSLISTAWLGKSQAQTTEPSVNSDQPLTPAATNTTFSSAAPVIGFGTNVTLGSALKSVLPPDTDFSFASGATASKIVSWSGGQPWPQTVTTIAKSVGYQATISGNHITITPQSCAPITPSKTHHHYRRARHLITHRYIAYGQSYHVFPNGPDEYDSPTIEQMSPQQALPVTLPPAGATLPTGEATTGPTPGQPYVPSYNIAGAPGASAVPSWNPDATTTGYSDMRGYIPGQQPVEEEVWHVAAGSTLLGTLQQWCAQAGDGWTVYPDTSINYIIHGSMDFSGNIEQATTQLVNAIHAPVMPYAQIHTESKNIILTDAEHNSISMGGDQ
jgi:hypothetical protein